MGIQNVRTASQAGLLDIPPLGYPQASQQYNKKDCTAQHTAAGRGL